MGAPTGNKKKSGRPAAYSETRAKKILELVAGSTKSLKTICDKNPDLPGHSTVRRWIAEDQNGFRERYARAKEEQADMMADEILEIADKLTGKGLSSEKVNAARLRVDARKWVAAKLKPKTYGEKIDHTTAGESLNKGFLGLMMETNSEKEE